MNAGAAYAYPCASPGAGGLSCAAAARGYQASTISAMLQMRGDRTVFISLLLLRSEDHEGREYPTPRARAGLSRKRPDATSARGSGQAEGSQRPRRRNRRCANSSGEESERGRYRADGPAGVRQCVAQLRPARPVQPRPHVMLLMITLVEAETIVEPAVVAHGVGGAGARLG